MKKSKIESFKSELLPSNFDLESVDWTCPSERDRFYLKNYGIYNIKLRPKSWMLRLRLDGGVLEPEKAIQIAKLAQQYRARILLSARSQIELHDLKEDNIYSLYKELQSIQIKTAQTLTDNVRAIITDPLFDCAKDAYINTLSLIQELQNSFLEVPEYIGTIPRKFNTAIIGRETPSFNPWGNDLIFALAKKDSILGFNIYLGGKNNQSAKSANIFCTSQEAKELFKAILETFKRYGLRQSRSKARLFHLIEAVGMDNLRMKIEEELKNPLKEEGVLQVKSSSYNRDYLLNIDRFGKYGEIEIDTLYRVAKEARDFKRSLRLTPYQELWSFNPNTLFDSKNSKYINEKITACAGFRYCPLSLWDIKSDIEELMLEPLLKSGIHIGFSGCLKGCGRHQHNDIGLVGLRTNAFGNTERALRIFLGALEAPNPTPARLLYYAVPQRSIGRLFEVILEDFQNSNYKSFEEFSRNILWRYTQESLALWYLLRQLKATSKIEEIFYQAKEKILLEAMKSLTIYPKEAFNIQEAILSLSHRVWDKKD